MFLMDMTWFGIYRKGCDAFLLQKKLNAWCSFFTIPVMSRVDSFSRWYVKVKHENDFYCLIVTPSTTYIVLRRKLAMITGQRVHDMRLHLPDFGNRVFEDRHSLDQARLGDGTSLIMVYCIRGTEFEIVETLPELSIF
jgi:hypothetical protein